MEGGKFTGALLRKGGQAGSPAHALGPVIEHADPGAARTATTTQSIAGFKDNRFVAAQTQLPRTGQSCDTGADDRNARWRPVGQYTARTAVSVMLH